MVQLALASSQIVGYGSSFSAQVFDAPGIRFYHIFINAALFLRSSFENVFRIFYGWQKIINSVRYYRFKTNQSQTLVSWKWPTSNFLNVLSVRQTSSDENSLSEVREGFGTCSGFTYHSEESSANVPSYHQERSRSPLSVKRKRLSYASRIWFNLCHSISPSVSISRAANIAMYPESRF